MKPFLGALLTLISLSHSAAAQGATSASAAVLSFADADVTIGPQKIVAGAQSTPLNRDQSIATGAGRAEVMLSPCVIFHLDENSGLRIVANRLTDTRVELTSGSALVRADGILRNTSVSVHIGGNEVPLTDRGVYGFEASPPRVSIFKGKVEVQRPGKDPLKIGAGRIADLSSTAAPVRFKADQQADEFGLWSLSRAVTLLLQSGYNEEAERERERRERAWK